MHVYELEKLEGVLFDWVLVDIDGGDTAVWFGPEDEYLEETHLLIPRNEFTSLLRGFPEFEEGEQ